jgi:hypothetical protein
MANKYCGTRKTLASAKNAAFNVAYTQKPQFYIEL